MTSGVIVVLVAALVSLGMYAQMMHRKRALAQRAFDEAAAAKIVFLSRSPIRRELARATRAQF